MQTDLISGIDNNFPISKSPMHATSRSRIEMDGVSAAWLLFQFSRNNKEDRVSHSIRTILPNGDLKVVNIEVKYLADRRSAQDKNSPKGLPGAFAQDILIALIDTLVGQIKSDCSELVAKARTIGLGGIPIPPNCTEVYFRNKDLANRMGMTEKNSKITKALHHLHQTHISIKGCIYQNGKETPISHDAYYISALTAGKVIRQGTEKSEWNKAKFDDVLVKHILQGYIAQMDTEKLLQLPSGAPRKLYTLIAAKVLERDGLNTVVITKDEILNTLQIKKTYYKELTRKYFQSLIDAKIISQYEYVTHRGVEVVAFTVVADLSKEALPVPSSKATDFFQMLEEVSRSDAPLAAALENKRVFDLDKRNLEQLITSCPGEIEYNGSRYPLPILYADMIIHNICKGQNVKTVVGLVKSCLKKRELPIAKPGFVPINERFRKIVIRREAAKAVDFKHTTSVAE